ncbi:hypothetical protein R75461_07543 [Paraburkholderia nemoris]|nr:hypothetical protein R75461_07543 [Paraburkholderia nemoris]
MDANVIICEALYRRAYVHRITAEAIKLRDNEDIAWFNPIQQTSELWTLAGRDAAADVFGDDASLIYRKASRRYFAYLVFGVLICGADAGINEISRHPAL